MNVVNKINDGYNVYGYIVWKVWCELIIDEYNFYVWILFYESVDMN